MTTTQGLPRTSAARCDEQGFAGLVANLTPEREGIAAQRLLADREQPLDQAGVAQRYVGWSLLRTSSTRFTVKGSSLSTEPLMGGARCRVPTNEILGSSPAPYAGTNARRAGVCIDTPTPRQQSKRIT